MDLKLFSLAGRYFYCITIFPLPVSVLPVLCLVDLIR